jgi:exopolysaccharide/PEP-CTERM locus tyrosine autokinase
MGLIEQAVELLNQASAQQSVDQSRAVEPSVGQLVDRRVAEPAAERSAGAPAATPDQTTTPMPCRSDRALRIDVLALRGSGLLAPEADQRQLAEEYRIIKRPLLAGLKGESPLRLGNVIVVASALPGEGKTFTSINLALSLALERGREVLLVDGDVAKPHITQLFGLETEPGLLDLVGAAARSFEDTIVKTDYPSLYVLPAGSRNLQATEILRSERTSSLLAALAAEPHRIVLIDSPPLLVTSEAGVLTSLAGQVVLVVKAAHTPQEAVLHAIETISEGKPVSLVLNQADAVPEHRYAYYGQYGYGKADSSTADVASGSDPA